MMVLQLFAYYVLMLNSEHVLKGSGVIKNEKQMLQYLLRKQTKLQYLLRKQTN